MCVCVQEILSFCLYSVSLCFVQSNVCAYIYIERERERERERLSFSVSTDCLFLSLQCVFPFC